jgi:KDEL-tailed cysteine endopeptidase
VYARNRRYIEEHNKKVDRRYSLGMNKYADLTNAEFRERYAKRQQIKEEKGIERVWFEESDAVPQMLDWREMGGVNPV